MSYQNLSELLQDIDDGLFALSPACLYLNDERATKPDGVSANDLQKLYDASTTKKWRKTLCEWWFELYGRASEQTIAIRAAQNPSIFKLLAPHKVEISNWINSRKQPQYYWQIFHLDEKPNHEILEKILTIPIQPDTNNMRSTRVQYERVLSELELNNRCSFWFRLGFTQSRSQDNHIADIIAQNKKRYPTSEGLLYNAAWSIGALTNREWYIDPHSPEYEIVTNLSLEQRIQLLQLLSVDKQLPIGHDYNEKSKPKLLNAWMTIITLGLPSPEIDKIASLYHIVETSSIDEQSRFVVTVLKNDTPKAEIELFSLGGN